MLENISINLFDIRTTINDVAVSHDYCTSIRTPYLEVNVYILLVNLMYCTSSISFSLTSVLC